MRKFSLLLLVALLILGQRDVAGHSEDLYSLLGVSRAASAQEIKRGYKKSAMQFHPDKNTSPEASERMMQINKAYEILSDPTRKQRYDAYGNDRRTPAERIPPRRRAFRRFRESPLILSFYPFGGGGGRGKPSEFEKHRLTLRMYLNSVLERSYTQPFLIFAYSSYCPACFALESHWTEAVKDLEQFGYGIGTVNYMVRAIHYRGNYHQLNARSIRLFARDAIPNTFMHRLNTYNGLKRFLDQWEPTNKPSVIFVGASKEPRLRYLLAAMKHSHFIRFAYIHLADPSADIGEMKAAFGIECSDCENVIVFNDEPKAGVSDRLSTVSQIDQNQLARFLERNKFLSSSTTSAPSPPALQRRYCLLLPVGGSADDQKYVQAMRRFVKQHKELLQRLNVHISYINVHSQRAFMDQFAHHLQWEEGSKRDILVLWRHEYVKAKYAWIPSIWSSDGQIEHKTFEELKNYVLQMSRGEFRLEETAQIPTLVRSSCVFPVIIRSLQVDEYQPSLFTRVSRQVVRMAMTLWFHATKEDVLPVVSVVGTLAFILVIGYLLNYFIGEHKLPAFDGEKPPAYSGTPTIRRPTAIPSVTQRRWREMEPMIHELRAETYFGLIRLLKPGCRSIIVIVDEESKDLLLPQFARYVYPLRKNKTFSFGYLVVPKNLLWFRTLLEHTLPVDNEDPSASSSQFAAKMFNRLKASGSLVSIDRRGFQGINPKQTLGTVLVLCGYKLYFSMYHPMHVASRVRGSSEDTDDLSEDEPKPPRAKDAKTENVLNGFPNFLDRLLEGSVRRYYVPEWNENLK
ncbi:DnaJ domain protein [Aphelenchoides fujianensis]|nr:DnaJ domain protein [Aphelenchoides fujianensis]